MPAKRKTLEVETFKEWANSQLARTDVGATEDFRKGVCAMLEQVLHATGNYRGFGNLKWVQGGYQQWVIDGKPDHFTDDPRYYGAEYQRCYY